MKDWDESQPEQRRVGEMAREKQPLEKGTRR